jgi:hypothetical protein
MGKPCKRRLFTRCGQGFFRAVDFQDSVRGGRVGFGLQLKQKFAQGGGHRNESVALLRLRSVNPDHVVLEVHIIPPGGPSLPDSGPGVGERFDYVRTIFAFPPAVVPAIGLPDLSHQLHKLTSGWNLCLRESHLWPFDTGRRIGQ